MALVKNTNSYVDLTDANTYFGDRIDVAAWDAADDLEKEKALVTATAFLDELDWTGQAVSDIQSLAFPRIGQYFDPKLGAAAYLSDTEVPDRILKATYELAYHLLNNDGLLDDTGSVQELEIGPIKLINITGASKIPSFVKRMVKPLLVNQGARHWWRAN